MQNVKEVSEDCIVILDLRIDDMRFDGSDAVSAESGRSLLSVTHIGTAIHLKSIQNGTAAVIHYKGRVL